jgi:CheY-like chemotaxis protein
MRSRGRGTARVKPYVVLHVEDDEGDRAILAAAFRKVAPQIHLAEAADGAQAIAYLSGQGPHQDRESSPLPNLILLDLKLPKKSGLDVLEWVRSRSELRELPVFMLTSSNDPSDLDRAVALGANSYLIKTVDLYALREIVRGIAEFASLMGTAVKQPTAIGS